eukprot:CAMPEP_0174967212 /NCGR_PEP_ID=MMETSP0004_2-20121128/7459_1 /TAXON_ID=420556 /ORGANISM="Ochromonas sp., Strain CCMP1393" /LENGTH=1048 /DNA_ID=CAMNT_0016216321 /DNA_START=14 /DNA_END=3160 /DNA_ORIENTATION=-
MSLFASLGQGDIWALSGISFASPINDLLDKGEFTLENLLEEDELIQEVKSKNERLIEFLSLESTMDHLLDFIVNPASADDNDFRTFKYPYMSCEVICCEVPEILKNLVEEYDGKYLDKLFSFLSTESRLNYYLAGYFEKILEMLFRRMTVPMMKYFNDAGTTLMSKFLDHMDNYSIMQIVQRLMLPHIPFSNLVDAEVELTEEEKSLQQCNWSFSDAAIQLLFDRMLLDGGDADVPLHISDLLITVLQLSPPETLVIKFLCEASCIRRLLDAAVTAAGTGASASASNSSSEGEAADVMLVGDPYSVAASISLAAISVLESLNSRLFESSIPYDQQPGSSAHLDGDGAAAEEEGIIVIGDATSADQGGGSGASDGIGMTNAADEEYLIIVRQQISSICIELVPFIEKINTALRRYLSDDDPPCLAVRNQGKTLTGRLGHRGLQIVKLVESIVRLGDSSVDAVLCTSGTFKICLDLYFKFENNSFLHLSVQRIFITILESDSTRSATQRHILTGCDLLRTVMTKMGTYLGKCDNSFAANEHNRNEGAGEGEGDNVEDGGAAWKEVASTKDPDEGDSNTTSDGGAVVASSSTSKAALGNKSLLPKHTSAMGNMVLIAQALSVALDNEVIEEDKLSDTQNTDMALAPADADGSLAIEVVDMEILDNSDSDNVESATIVEATVGGIAGIGNDTNDVLKSGVVPESNGVAVAAGTSECGQEEEKEEEKEAKQDIDGSAEVDATSVDASADNEDTVAASDSAVSSSDAPPDASVAEVLETGGVEGIAAAADIDETDKIGSLRSLVAEDENLLNEWDSFVQDVLHSVLEHQMVGSYNAVANMSGFSQDDPLKLGVDMDIFNLNNEVNHLNMGFSNNLAAEASEGAEAGMGGSAWGGQQPGGEGYQLEDDDDDEFMFRGPAAASTSYNGNEEGEGGGSSHAFRANFDFSQTQTLPAAGLEQPSGVPVAAFADFASFGAAAAMDNDSSSPDSSSGTGDAFAAFDQLNNSNGSGDVGFATFGDIIKNSSGAASPAAGDKEAAEPNSALDFDADFAPTAF